MQMCAVHELNGAVNKLPSQTTQQQLSWYEIPASKSFCVMIESYSIQTRRQGENVWTRTRNFTMNEVKITTALRQIVKVAEEYPVLEA